MTGASVGWTSHAGAIVALGDSIADRAASNLNANHRWPDILARRLQRYRRIFDLGVVNIGIGGNRPVPEPLSLALLVVGLASLAAMRSRSHES